MLLLAQAAQAGGGISLFTVVAASAVVAALVTGALTLVGQYWERRSRRDELLMAKAVEMALQRNRQEVEAATAGGSLWEPYDVSFLAAVYYRSMKAELEGRAISEKDAKPVNMIILPTLSRSDLAVLEGVREHANPAVDIARHTPSSNPTSEQKEELLRINNELISFLGSCHIINPEVSKTCEGVLSSIGSMFQGALDYLSGGQKDRQGLRDYTKAVHELIGVHWPRLVEMQTRRSA